MKLSRRTLLKLLSVSLAAGGAGYSVKTLLEGNRRRPNIVLVIADDMNYASFGAAGNDKLHTPNIDALAREGWMFTEHFVTTSVCPISRATMLTGQHVLRHKVWGFYKNLTRAAFLQTYPALLRKRGYFTGHIGKWGIDDTSPYPAWLYSMFLHPFRSLGQYWQMVRVKGALRFMHLNDVQKIDVRKFLNKCPEDQPFFLSVCTFAPHYPFQPQSAFKKLYLRTPFPRPVTDTPKEFASIRHIFALSQSRGDYLRDMGTDSKRHSFLTKYYGLITGVDDLVGAIRKDLEKRKMLDDTIIIFTSDNGYQLGEHGLAGKWCMFESSIRVPLVIWHGKNIPLQPERKKIFNMTLNVDIAPTILDYAEIPVPDYMQGMSLRKVIASGEDTRDDFFYVHPGFGPVRRCEGVRGREWKYTRYFMRNGQTHELLFNIAKDPLEQNNLMDAPEAAEPLESLRKTYKLHKKKLA